MKALYFLIAFSVLVSLCSCVSFIPAMDIMGYSSDGSLVTIWGEHNFYQDTTPFGHPVTYHNGTFYVGGNHARAS